MWVNANFKETQLTDVRIGQSVNIISVSFEITPCFANGTRRL
jgi:multidrug resistance efflux pump